ncbi:hypothetical protein [Desulfotruncus alcoholivorax]|uniref:hypothetical protein n=1 Tax=Desulfotruncus alcoholivorax TaxID=265477 RepID=UPI00040B6207|nr:hypothetical protein [Desulfotruncus alcoholivorax]
MDKKVAKLAFESLYGPTIESVCREFAMSRKYQFSGGQNEANADGQLLVLYRLALQTKDAALIAEMEALAGY